MLEHELARAWEELAGRVDGPLSARIVVQPTMAIFFAVLAGLRDAKSQRGAFLESFLRNHAERSALLRDGWKDIRMVASAAFLLDAVYQVIVLRWFHPLQALFVAAVLALAPYVLVRGPIRRVVGWARSANRSAP